MGESEVKCVWTRTHPRTHSLTYPHLQYLRTRAHTHTHTHTHTCHVMSVVWRERTALQPLWCFAWLWLQGHWHHHLGRGGRDRTVPLKRAQGPGHRLGEWWREWNKLTEDMNSWIEGEGCYKLARKQLILHCWNKKHFAILFILRVFRPSFLLPPPPPLAGWSAAVRMPWSRPGTWTHSTAARHWQGKCMSMIVCTCACMNCVSASMCRTYCTAARKWRCVQNYLCAYVCAWTVSMCVQVHVCIHGFQIQ